MATRAPQRQLDRAREQNELVRRFRELRAAGYPPDDAAEVAARGDVDLRLAVRLLREGCPAELALRILC